jgi:abhydrolase domain-containing protein 17
MSTKYHNFKGTILECPFMSCIKVVTNTSLLSSLDLFVNINKIPNVNAPVFILHGDQDQVISQEHGKELYKALPEEFRYPPE